jgi:hypothetical protein
MLGSYQPGVGTLGTTHLPACCASRPGAGPTGAAPMGGWRAWLGGSTAHVAPLWVSYACLGTMGARPAEVGQVPVAPLASTPQPCTAITIQCVTHMVQVLVPADILRAMCAVRPGGLRDMPWVVLHLLAHTPTYTTLTTWHTAQQPSVDWVVIKALPGIQLTSCENSSLVVLTDWVCLCWLVVSHFSGFGFWGCDRLRC